MREAVARLEAIGVRPIVVRDAFAVLELRGGTHIVVREAKDDAVHEVSFDLMVDGIEEGEARFRAAGFETTAIERGRIHASFTATAPERFRVRVNDSHAGTRPV